MLRIVFAFLMLSVALPAPAAASGNDPIAFFTGRSEGRGVLKKMLSAKREVAVRSSGRIDGQGWLVLAQHIEGVDDKPSDRIWRMRLVNGRIEGTLTDAAGPVTGDVTGTRLHLAYIAKDRGLAIDQWIDFAGDGRSATNHMTARKFGMTVATLDETIRRVE